VRHRRFDIASLSVEGVDLPLKAAYLLVVDRDEVAELQWECLAYALDPAPVAEGRYVLSIATLEGRQLSGAAVLVRSVDGAHVLRGDGPLAGVAADELS
jgi:hypothetical protein